MSQQAQKTPIARQNQSYLTGAERKLNPSETIVSKTNLKGIITYANLTFLDISGFTEKEILGSPHSILRHPHMPRVVFKLLWDTLKNNEEIFAYVVNRCKNGDHYWVLAHVTPCLDIDGKVIGYHSSRRAPAEQALKRVQPFYKKLLEIENAGDRREGLVNSEKAIFSLLEENRMTYSEFVFSL